MVFVVLLVFIVSAVLIIKYVLNPIVFSVNKLSEGEINNHILSGSQIFQSFEKVANHDLSDLKKAFVGVNKEYSSILYEKTYFKVFYKEKMMLKQCYVLHLKPYSFLLSKKIYIRDV